MPGMPSSPLQGITFGSLIAEQLETLQEALAEKAEALAKEREKVLQEEIELLTKQNAELRSRLQAENAPLEPKFVENVPQSQVDIVDIDKGKVEEANDVVNVAEIDTSDILAVQQDSASSSTSRGPFQLLPELMDYDTWDGVIDEHNASYLERAAKDAEKMGNRMILEPSSTVKLVWDVFGIPILGWDLITIPMGVFDIGSTGEKVMEAAGWLIMLYWTADMPVTFFTGYYDFEGELVMEPSRIRKHYLRTNFFLDLLIISGDWVTVIIEAIGSSAPGFLSNLAILRALRITRFLRLMRLRKLKEKVQTLEDSIDNEWTLVILNLISKVLAILILNHYIACVWFALGTWTSLDSAPYRWVTSVPYPQYDYKELGDQRVSDAAWLYQYFTSLHWAIAQFTPGPQNIQPQNWVERFFVVCILLFGMVIFSSFIASVTQARMQLNKMMSKFERDNWLLRKFCRQHHISRGLQTHMRRYIDLVIIPNYHKLTISDVVLIPKLSAHLRAQLQTELMVQNLIVHPLFLKLNGMKQNIIHYVCNSVAEIMSLARGDVAFSGGVVAKSMVMVTNGSLDYIPIQRQKQEELKLLDVPKGHWCCEAVLWTKWTHQGQLQASIESTVILVNGAKFRAGLQENGFIMSFVRTYGMRFCEGLTRFLAEQGSPTDLHEQVAHNIDLSISINDFLKQKMFLPNLMR